MYNLFWCNKKMLDKCRLCKLCTLEVGSGDSIFLRESTRGVEIRLHTKNQHPRCPGSGLKVCVGVVGVGRWVNQI